MKKKLFGKKIFTLKEQKTFSRISSDYNSAHVGVIKNKKLISGSQVVHGINILATVVEFWLKNNKNKPYFLECNFLKPIFINQLVSFFYLEVNKSKYYIEVVVNNLVHTKIFFDLKIKTNMKEKSFHKPHLTIKRIKKPLNYNSKKFLNKTYKVNFNKKDKFDNFSLTTSTFNKELCSALYSISFFVGMICPGASAIFLSIKINFNKLLTKNKFLLFNIKNYNNSLNLLNIITQGYLEAKIAAFHKHHNLKK